MSAVTRARDGIRSAIANPVLRRELVERWRGRRAFAVLTVYVAILAAVLGLLAWIGTEVAADSGFDAGGGFGAGPQLGRFLFENVVAFVLLLVLFITPGYAASQISGERERRTLGLLQITLIGPFGIVAGKLGSSVAWLLLLIVAAVPIGATGFFLGGVGLTDLVGAVGVTLFVAVAIAAVGIGISSLVRRTTAAIVVTYGLVLFLLFGSLFLALVESVAREFDFGPADRPVALYLNPYYGLADAVGATGDAFGPAFMPSVLTPFAAALPQDPDGTFGPEPVPPIEGGARDLGLQPEGVPGPFVEDQEAPRVWPWTLALYGAFGVLGVLVATRRVRPGTAPRRPERVIAAPGAVPLPPAPPSERGDQP